MNAERRNLYRILHVQPEAPTEIIKASYRALMSSLRVHPDLGGDPARAAEVNHAYAVLTDPERRRAYDLSLKQRARAASPAAPGAGAAASRTTPPRAAPAAGPRPAGGSATSAAGAPAASAASPAASTPRGAAPPAGAGPAPATAQPALAFMAWRADRRCPFCRTGFKLVLQPDTRCVTCDSPLMPAPDAQGAAHELLGRRGSQRHARDQEVTMRLPGVAQDQAARLRNLSLTGMGLTSPVRVARGSVVRIITPQFDALVGVVHQRTAGQGFQLHGSLLTLQLMRMNQGVFVSVKV